MKAYSEDLRSRIIAAVDQGKPRTEIVATFQVSRATIKRYLKQRRERGNLKAKAIPGRPATKRRAVQAGLVAQLEAHADVTVAEHCRLWEAQGGIKVSRATMGRAIAQLDWTRKKNHQGKRAE